LSFFLQVAVTAPHQSKGLLTAGPGMTSVWQF
jgi:hypothetical protein